MKTIGKSFIAATLAVVSMFGADNSLGTWKWNPGKSKGVYNNPLKSRVDMYEATPEGGVKITRTETRADGTTHNSSWTVKYDGKEYPVSGQQFDTMVIKQIDDYTTVNVVRTKNGRLVQASKNVYSKDGKTRTQTVLGFNANGDPVDVQFVYDKQ